MNKQSTFDPQLSPEEMEEMKGLQYRILEMIGEDPTREGLIKTPERVAKSLRFLTKGYREDPEEILRSAMFQRNIGRWLS